MRIYTAGLIDKSSQSNNATLQKRLLSHYRKSLGIPASAINSQELNTFIVLSGQKNDGNIDSKTIEKIEKRTLDIFTKYHISNKSKFEQELKNNQELRETSRIVKDFVKEVDPNLAKIFDSRLEKISKDIPNMHCEIQSRSIVTLWDIVENREHRFFLSGFDSPIFKSSTSETEMNMDKLVDKLLFSNFFKIFLKPTVARLQEMDRVLERLKMGVEGTHYRSKNQKLQTKLELFLRILAAKLSALHDIGSVISRIFDLFQFPRNVLPPYHLGNDAVNLNAALAGMASEIEYGKALLITVQDKLQECQIHLRDYLDEQKNGVKTIDSANDFQTRLLSIAELSIDLFVEAELLKTWTDLFGSDIPYFSFDRQLFDHNDSYAFDVADDIILAVRGLTKNYNLGKTTVYALRGVNLDIKEGEFVAILGNSGAGKTTLLNCIAGLDTPDHGVVLFRGKNLHKLSDSAKSKSRLLEMGFIFQTYALLPHFNTRENVALPADLAGLSKDLKGRIEKLLEGVGIDEQAKQYPATLSGGQMQRVAIARALTNRPAVIFADEPTGDLDSVTGKQVMDLLKKFHKETKTTIIVITHERDIADYAERKIMMKDGIITPS
jgi:putative ABC transport system ATP-binding protein